MIPDFYFDTHFKDIATATEFPARFGIITAYATTGETWTPEQNSAADIRLLKELESRGIWHTRITGYVGEHAEPGWATDLSLVDSIKLGNLFDQHGIYYVDNNTLSVHLSDGTNQSAHVADFSERIQPN